VTRTLFEAEIREQPAALRRLLDEGRDAVERAADGLRAKPARFAVLAARGSSDNAARYGQYLFGIRNQLAVALATPSLYTQYEAAPHLEGALVVGISQSGQSPDIVAVVREGRRQGAFTVAITNEPASPLGQAAEHVIALRAGTERAVAATKTYTTQLLALAMLSAGLAGDAAAWAELQALPDALNDTLADNETTAAQASRFREHTGLVTVARGYNFSTAFEIALKVTETCAIPAVPYSSADLLHGPTAMIEPELPVLLVAPGPREFPDLDQVETLARERGAPIVAVSDRAHVLERADVALRLPPGTPEWLTPLTAIVPGQLFALGLSLARGKHPDAPRGLAKVTLTR
jgi:glucosamine--fructose-6-phosphate aminotransferase (isomerizing)